jgi:N-acetylmuramoyl-L-alanine amidase
MKMIKHYLVNNRCYTSKNKIEVKKLVLHSTGCAQPDADIIIANMNNESASESVHGFIETDRVIQTLPWNYKAWHVGSGNKGSYNSCAIGIEICEPKGHTYQGGSMREYNVDANAEYFRKVYNNAVELFAYLCKKFNLDPIKDILCHCEVHTIGYGSNHSDVMQWFPKHGKNMDMFRSDVKKKIGEASMPKETITPKSSKEDIKWAQRNLNNVLPKITRIIPLSVDGYYGAKTRIAVLIYWDQLGWGKNMTADGTRIGKATREALEAGRKS